MNFLIFLVVLSSTFVVAVAACNGDCPSQSQLLLQTKKNSRVLSPRKASAETRSLDIMITIQTCTVPFADTETGANISFNINDQWTDPLQLTEMMPQGSVVNQRVRLSAWPSAIRFKALGEDSWCVDSISVSSEGYNVSALKKSMGPILKANGSVHWITEDDATANTYVVPPFKSNNVFSSWPSEEIDTVITMSTCSSSFADTETGADISFKINDQWTAPVLLVKMEPTGGVVNQEVRLSGWPSAIRLNALGDDSWCVDSINMSANGYNITVLEGTAVSKVNQTESSRHWISQNNSVANTYVVAPLPQESTPCTTRYDERVSAWGYTTSEPDTLCVFGLDSRDEGEHCIFDDGVYGTFGWCYTNTDMSSWGACSESCPLWGQMKILGTKIDTVLNTVKSSHRAIEEALRLATIPHTTTSTTNIVNTTNATNTANMTNGVNATNGSNTTKTTNGT